MPKSLSALLGMVSDTYIVIAASSFSIILLIALLFVVRGIFAKFGKNKILGLPISVFSVATIVVMVVLSTVSSHQLVCQSCHPMRAPAVELRTSSHKGIGCLACHKKSNMMALPIQKLEQLRMTFNYFSGSYKYPVRSEVGNDVCLECHGDVRRGLKVKFKVMMSHAEVVDAGINCTECHPQIAHKGAAAKSGVSMMEKCSSCHNDEEASSRCETCHQGDVWLGMKPSTDWGISHDKNWAKTHGARSLYICKACHYEKDCNRCHSTVPHQEGWPYIHGQQAESNPDDCNICHKEESFCRGCHKITMPHPPSWLPLHKWEVDIAGRGTCLSCHIKKDCDRCHDKHSIDVEIMGKKKQ
ncbi:cytochrome c3 family protein [Candidatus Aquicultor secundus]|nr:cytochrome c3 family protein [Candidatus Aquicultor secundus]NCO66737.1 hypothetical protein [Solirubrobacter sp.]